MQPEGDSSSSSRLLIPGSFVHRRGDHPYGLREYLLVRPAPAAAPAKNVGGDASILRADPDGSSSMQILASLKANCNIVFGAAVFVNNHNSGTGS